MLVIADPAEDARLYGAEQEGLEVASLFESFGRAIDERRAAEPENEIYQSGVEVKRLIGPREATRTNVLRELTLRPYDVLHYAGHCMYDSDHPSASGWIFTGGHRLSVNEMRRIDHIPKFVFSNACESGITPDRAELRSPELAPSFAEAFFERGVSNFVCTAWPVDDAAARTFALTLYRNLLGLVPDPTNPADGTPGFLLEGDVMPMHRAMQQARLAIGHSFGGGRTWGAYQHYGNPNFRLFDQNAWPRKPHAEPAKRRPAAAPSAPPGPLAFQGERLRRRR